MNPVSLFFSISLYRELYNNIEYLSISTLILSKRIFLYVASLSILVIAFVLASIILTSGSVSPVTINSIGLAIFQS